MTAHTVPRFLRSSVLATLILSFSIGSHVLGGGTLPHPAVLLLLGVLVLAPVTAASGRTFSFPVLAGVLLGGELGLHAALTALTGAASCGTAAPAPHHGPAIVACPPIAGTGIESAEPNAALMFLAHAVAAAVLALLMTKGETALALLAAWLRPLVGGLETVAVVPRRRSGTIVRTVGVQRRRRYSDVPPLRGPPSGAALHLLPA